MKVKEKAQKVLAKRAELSAQFPSGDCVLISVPSDTYNTKGGVIMEVPVDSAAQHLVEQTHRLAKAEEIEAFREAQEADRKRIYAAQLAQPDLLKSLLGKAIELRGPGVAQVHEQNERKGGK